MLQYILLSGLLGCNSPVKPERTEGVLTAQINNSYYDSETRKFRDKVEYEDYKYRKEVIPVTRSIRYTLDWNKELDLVAVSDLSGDIKEVAFYRDSMIYERPCLKNKFEDVTNPLTDCGKALRVAYQILKE